MTTRELIAQTEALLDRCGAAMLESYSFQVWRKAQDEARDHQALLDAMPCQEYGREEIDPDTWRA